MKICKDCPLENVMACVKNLTGFCKRLGFTVNADKLHCHDVIDVQRCPLERKRKAVMKGSLWSEGESGIFNVSLVSDEPTVEWDVDGMYYPRWRAFRKYEICGDVLDERSGRTDTSYYVQIRSDGYMPPTVIVGDDEDYIDLTEDEVIQVKDMLAYENGVNVDGFEEPEFDLD